MRNIHDKFNFTFHPHFTIQHNDEKEKVEQITPDNALSVCASLLKHFSHEGESKYENRLRHKICQKLIINDDTIREKQNMYFSGEFPSWLYYSIKCRGKSSFDPQVKTLEILQDFFKENPSFNLCEVTFANPYPH